jgi:hypothetical protein
MSQILKNVPQNYAVSGLGEGKAWYPAVVKSQKLQKRIKKYQNNLFEGGFYGFRNLAYWSRSID